LETLSPSSLELAASELIEDALAEIEFKYGENGEHPKIYHNLQHTKDVLEATRAIAALAVDRGKITEKEATLLLIAAAYHDIVHGGDENEKASADIASSRMKSFSIFSDSDISIVTDAILGTKTKLIDGRLHQAAANKGSSIYARILADSDLSSLGSRQEVFWSHSQAIFSEQNPDGSGWDDFIKLQCSILSNHRYLTEEARELYPHLPDNLEFVKTFLTRG
jgi:predicted metal-dependent HD superfamily phosphohydrolase